MFGRQLASVAQSSKLRNIKHRPTIQYRWLHSFTGGWHHARQIWLNSDWLCSVEQGHISIVNVELTAGRVALMRAKVPFTAVYHVSMILSFWEKKNYSRIDKKKYFQRFLYTLNLIPTQGYFSKWFLYCKKKWNRGESNARTMTIQDLLLR